MAQSLSGIVCKSQLQATMAATAGRTNISTNPKIAHTVSHSLTSSTVDVTYSFKATKQTTGTDVWDIIWSSGTTDTVSGTMDYTMRDVIDDVQSGTTGAAEIQHDPEFVPVVAISRIVAVHLELPATNNSTTTMAGTGADFMPDMKFQGGDSKARSVLLVPQVLISDLTSTTSAKSQFTMVGAVGNSITVTVFGKT